MNGSQSQAAPVASARSGDGTCPNPIGTSPFWGGDRNLTRRGGRSACFVLSLVVTQNLLTYSLLSELALSEANGAGFEGGRCILRLSTVDEFDQLNWQIVALPREYNWLPDENKNPDEPKGQRPPAMKRARDL